MELIYFYSYEELKEIDKYNTNDVIYFTNDVL